MPRKVDSKAKTPDIHWRPTTEQDIRLCRDIKKILENNETRMGDFLRPFLEEQRRRRSPSNAQSILTPEDTYPISLSQAQREKLGIPEDQAIVFEQEIECQNCHTHHKAQVTCYGKPGEYHQ